MIKVNDPRQLTLNFEPSLIGRGWLVAHSQRHGQRFYLPLRRYVEVEVWDMPSKRYPVTETVRSVVLN